MAIVSPFVKLFVTAGASIAIIQGVVWFILSLMAILLYSKVWELETDPKTYGQFLSATFVRLYADVNGFSLFVTSVGLLVWAIIYLIASIVWIFISIFLLNALKNQNRQSLRKCCQNWFYWTTLICVMDLVLTSLLARDYDYMVGVLNLDPIRLYSADTFMPLAIGVLMTLAARGFVLWIFNLIFAVVMQILPIKFFQKRLEEPIVTESAYQNN